MSTTRNRGKQSNDDTLFSTKWIDVIKEATDDLCYLLTRGYPESSTLQLVGHKYRLNKRQHDALSRISCNHNKVTDRSTTEIECADLKGKAIEIDGFNLLILLENALSGAYIFKARDGLYRDISSVHGTYKRVTKTEEALCLIGNVLNELNISTVKWYFDQPVSNSGSLKTRLLELSKTYNFPWEVELVFDPDKVLAKSEHIVVSSDGWIIDNANKWSNLGAFIIENYIKEANTITV
ncbi:DUF434 domain-containing protein [Flammeovirga kamogawensis]|uniref:DUF434 domain-containing protein n=1 Tax=Flammeovirga kamogawensis TaxID=373891 RepID=A0ABX8H5P1_9BACT|nr:DUF434 domain-containing protein [Flammeovirga kamogawensis]MBB6461815.1 hypothetical protein [Flammeovirga kamogawensis]QWG10731.1 DUF434 domain-containing protein [Flammeovirga kamogawensis]TRX63833.1 DUF434 domain-containing protein [Flammeovirga kamogawensis]